MLPSLLPVILMWLSLTKGNTFQCREGLRLSSTVSGDEVCIPCDDGVNFMSEKLHTDTACQNCSQIVDPGLEVLVRACNRTHDAEILCRDGYDRYTARNVKEKNRCEPCQVCEHPTRACQGHNNTVCCPAANYDAVMNSEGQFECKEKPVVCDPGQYLRRHKNECLPCPDDTYMAARNHRNHQCLKCEPQSGDSETHAVIVRPCSSTSPTLFGCKTGYFRDPSQESTQIEVTCVACQVCSRELTKCDMYHDATCHQDVDSKTTGYVGDDKSTGDEKPAGNGTFAKEKFNKDTSSSQKDASQTNSVDADGADVHSNNYQSGDEHQENITKTKILFLPVYFLYIIMLIIFYNVLSYVEIPDRWRDRGTCGVKLYFHMKIRIIKIPKFVHVIVLIVFLVIFLLAGEIIPIPGATGHSVRCAMLGVCCVYVAVIAVCAAITICTRPWLTTMKNHNVVQKTGLLHDSYDHDLQKNKEFSKETNAVKQESRFGVDRNEALLQRLESNLYACPMSHSQLD